MKFRSYVMSRFGINLPPGLVVEEKGDRVYIYTKPLSEYSDKIINRRGLLAGKLKSLFGIKPSLDFVLTFGHLATRNVIDVPAEMLAKNYSGDSLELGADFSRGLYILRSGRDLGFAHFDGKRFISLIPKNRRVRI